MYMHEIYVDNAKDAKYIHSNFVWSEIQSYVISPDDEMHIIKVVRRYGHEHMVKTLFAIDASFLEVFTNKL